MNARTLEKRLLFVNGGVIAVNKLAGEAVEGAGKGQADLGALLAERFGAAEAVHRLDVPVTGCVLFARTRAVRAFLGGEFARAGKRYWAVTEKTVAVAENGELIHWIGRSARNNKSAAYCREAPGLKKSVLRYRMLGEGKHYLFLEVDLVTGRHHQIRAQFEAAGIHIKGDLKYGAKRSEKGGGIRLHARSLRFPDPASPSTFIRVAADPPVMDRLWLDFAAAAAVNPSGAEGP